MMDKHKKIKELKEQLGELDPIVEKRFNSSKELKRHVEKYKNVYQKAHDLFEQIQQLEWDLMTPEEQEREKEVLRLMKEKREGKMH
ncbi:hypothetical protein [Myroides fluvii]|uniref:hypothetical protein n=1 Tax=Myroides fluvii TaxID=2572594 RepID=UPI00131B1A5D|nr:hypothetical protein [Myroides fluvii]